MEREILRFLLGDDLLDDALPRSEWPSELERSWGVPLAYDGILFWLLASRAFRWLVRGESREDH
jgi:hypothetical protein